MDARTLRVLEFPKIRERLVALALFPPGKELAEALWPSQSLEEASVWQQETTEARALLEEGEVPLRGAKDIRDQVQRAAKGGRLDPPELLDVRDTLRVARLMKGYLQSRAQRAPFLAAIGSGIQPFVEVEEAIQRAIGEDASVLDSASERLARLRQEQRTVHHTIKEKLEEILRSPLYAPMLQEPLITLRGQRYVVPVKAEHKGRFPGILHDQSASGATMFMEPLAIVPLGNRLRELEGEEQEEIFRILRALSGMIGERAGAILQDVAVLGRLDFIFAKAALSLEMDGVRPRLNNQGILSLRKARHPLLQPPPDWPGRVVPIDVELGDRFTTLIITGPNTGGKTVTLKTIGLLTLMAQAGLHIPAEEGSEVCVFPQVFADIGDEQSIEQNLSTFSSHMGAIVEILRNLEGMALVLLDEVGAGTDPTEGAALARALIEYLHAKGVRTAVTTHYNDLKLLASEIPGIENASVEFDPETLRPTFRLLIGVPGRSNAFIIASRLGLLPDIIERARSYLRREEVALDRLLTEIERDRQTIAVERAEAQRALQEATWLRKQYEEALRRLEEEKRRILASVHEEAERQFRQAMEQVDQLLRKIREEATERAVREAREALRALRREWEGRKKTLAPEPPGEPLHDVRVGESVYVASLGQEGVVTAPPVGGEVEVQLGAIKARVPLEDLRRVKESAIGKRSFVAGEPAAPGASFERLPPAIPSSLDLRGRTEEEALLELDRYLDQAFLAGIPRVTIIHGKGTGVLRKAVHRFLSDHPHVRRFRLGEAGEGGSGATVVELNV
ncbi:MAG: endonuclease MutS2 [Armatimonadota bacterium]|nr:endonuclease MutS2 [Armatimonadota bacterium]